MEIQVEIEDLRKRKLFVATPMYGGMCAGMFCRSTNDLSALAMHYGIELKYYYLFNESLITRARNYCCDEFMRSDCTHMLFIDADIGFEANDVVSMMALMDHEDEENPFARLIRKNVLPGKRSNKLLIKDKLMKTQIFWITLLATMFSILFMVQLKSH